jgi:hypothetical protein
VGNQRGQRPQGDQQRVREREVSLGRCAASLRGLPKGFVY